MSFSKIALLFVSLLFVSALYADDASSLKDDAQAKADKIADIAAELGKANSEASDAKDQKWKSCVGAQLGQVKGMVSSASSIVSNIASMVASGKVSQAQSQLVLLNSMVESAEKALIAAQSCERSNAPQPQAKGEQKTVAAKSGVSNAMTLDIGNDSPTEINRGAVTGSDSADAASVDGSGVPQTVNDTTATDVVAAATTETPEDAAQIEQVPDQEDQSPTM